MNVLPIVFAFFGFHLFARLVRLLFSFFEGWPDDSRMSWTFFSRWSRLGFRIASFVMGIFILHLSTVASSGKPLDVLLYTTVACESSLETFQAYAVVRGIQPMLYFFKTKRISDTTAHDTETEVSAFYDTTAGELVTFTVFFVLPIGLCLSPALPMQVFPPWMTTPKVLTLSSSNRYNFICFTIPVILSFCGQGIFAIKIRKNIKANKWKLTFNTSRVGVFITLLLMSTGLCTFTAVTVQQQRTISAAFLVAITIVPTAFVSLSALEKLLRALRICGVPYAVKVNSNSEFNITHVPTSSRGGYNVSVPEFGNGLDSSAEAIGVALSTFE